MRPEVSIRSRLFEAGEPNYKSLQLSVARFQSAPASLRRENRAAKVGVSQV